MHTMELYILTTVLVTKRNKLIVKHVYRVVTWSLEFPQNFQDTVHHLSFSLVGWRPSGQDAEPLKSAHKASSTACVCGSGVGGGVGGGVLVVYVCERWPIPAPRPVLVLPTACVYMV